VFANAFSIDDEMREVIKAIPETTLCVWNYAAGVRKGDLFDLSYARELTGIGIAEYEKDASYSNGYGAPALCPPLRIVDGDGLEVIDRYEDGEIKVARSTERAIPAVSTQSAVRNTNSRLRRRAAISTLMMGSFKFFIKCAQNPTRFGGVKALLPWRRRDSVTSCAQSPLVSVFCMVLFILSSFRSCCTYRNI
jgi:hypothetical protein